MTPRRFVRFLGVLALAAACQASEMRAWTPRHQSLPPMWDREARKQLNVGKADTIGFVSGGPFRARLLRTQGLQNERSKEMVVLELADGRIRGWPLLSFSEADQAYVRKQQAAAPAAATGPTTADAPYALRWQEYDPNADRDAVNVATTDHFALWYGNDRGGSGKVLFADGGFLPMNRDYFERMWAFFRDVMKAPMPMAGDADRRKIAVFLTGTGLPKHKEGWAFGARNIMIHPNAMLEGSSVIPHEFGHCMQYYSGGFRNSPYVGWFWECHANWSCHQFIPSHPAVLGWYYNRKHYELSSTRMNYGSWPFLQYMHESGKFPPGFCYRVWTANRKDDRDRSIESPFQTIMRLGAEAGVYQGDGVKGFGDTIGELAARLVTMDFIFQQTYLDSIWEHRGAHHFMPFRTVLEAVPDRAGWFRPPYAFAPMQYGIHIVDLLPQPGAKSIEVDFRGLVDAEEASDWRATIVLLDAEGRPRYGPMFRGGKCAVDLRPGEARAALAVAGTPGKYTPLRFRMGYHAKRRYPYEAAFVGCAPADRDVWHVDHEGVEGAAHAHGGGFVAKTARVDAAAYVGPGAQVLEQARVTGRARVEDHAVVRGSARVADDAVLSGWAIVEDRAKVGGFARVRDRARVFGEVELGEEARVIEFAKVGGRGEVRGHAVLKGFADVRNPRTDPAKGEPPRQVIAGSTVIGRDAEYHGRPEPVTFGRYYSWCAGWVFDEAEDGQYLYANWDFDRPNTAFVLDAWEYNDGFLRGSPAFRRDGDRKVLAFGGKDDYVLVGADVSDRRDMTIDVAIRWDGGAAGQRIFDFGSSPASCMYLTPRDEEGRLALVFAHGGRMQQARADGPLAEGRWVRLRVELAGDAARVVVDDKVVASHDAFTLKAEDLRAASNYLGRSQDGRHGLCGQMDHFRVYTKVFEDFAALGPPPEPEWDYRTYTKEEVAAMERRVRELERQAQARMKDDAEWRALGERIADLRRQAKAAGASDDQKHKLEEARRLEQQRQALFERRSGEVARARAALHRARRNMD